MARIGNVATLIGGVLVGSAAAVAVTEASHQLSAARRGEVYGGGAGSLVAGGVTAKVAYDSAHESTGVWGHLTGGAHAGNLIGVGLLGVGLGALIGGGIADAIGAGNSNPSNPSQPSNHTSAASIYTALTSDSFVGAHTNAEQRSELAAGAAQAGASADQASQALQQIDSDPTAGKELAAGDAVQLGAVALDHQETGSQAAKVYDDLVSATDSANGQIVNSLANAHDRAQLAEAAIDGGSTGTNAANLFGNVLNSTSGTVTAADAAKLAGSALEAHATSVQAVSALTQVATDAVTKSLSSSGREQLAEGALLGQTSGTKAVQDYKQLTGDSWVGQLATGGYLTTDSLARLSSAATAAGSTGTEAANMLVNEANDATISNDADNYTELVDLSVGAFTGGSTGTQAAQVYDTIAQREPRIAPQDLFELAAAAVAGKHDGASAAKAFDAATGTSGTIGFEQVMLASGDVSGYDAHATSPLQRWYSAQQ